MRPDSSRARRGAVAALCVLLAGGTVMLAVRHAYAARPRADLRMSEEIPLVDTAALRVHLLRFGPANGYLIETPVGVTLVDAGLPTSTRRVLRALCRLGREADLGQILITHAHIDHFGAAAALRDHTGATVLVHEEDAAALSAGRTHLGSVRSWEWSRTLLPHAEWLTTIRPTPADATLTHDQVLTGCGLDALNARVAHTPGHTPGSLTLLITDPTTGLTYAFAGDLFSATGGVHIQGSYADSWLQLAASVQKLQRLAPDLTFPGHGATAISAETLATLPLSAPIQRALERDRPSSRLKA